MSRIYHRGARGATFSGTRRTRAGPGDLCPDASPGLNDVMGRCGAGIGTGPCGAGRRYAPVAGPLPAGEAALSFEPAGAPPFGMFL